MAAALERLAPFLLHRCPKPWSAPTTLCRHWSNFSGPARPITTMNTTSQPARHLSNSLLRTLRIFSCRAAQTSLRGATRNFSVIQGLKAARAKLPFEVNLKVPKDTLLYQHTNERFFRMLSIFGVAQLLFWGQLAVFSYTSLDVIDTGGEGRGIQKDTFWGKVIMLQTQYKERIAGLCIAIGTMVLFFTVLYPRRTIRQLILLKGGHDLQVTTYTHFGRTTAFSVPVESLSVEAARASKASQVSLKLKGHRFYYLMDKKDGTFYDTNLFDYAVGIKRKL